MDAAEREILEEGIDASLYGLLLGLALDMVHEYRGYGTFATVCSDVAAVLPTAHPETSDNRKPKT